MVDETDISNTPLARLGGNGVLCQALL